MKIKLTYISNNFDLYISNYLSNYQKEDIRYEYQEYEIMPEDSYESLLENEEIKSADILIVDSILFENESVGYYKMFGGVLKVAFKKNYPLKKVLVIALNDEEECFSDLSRFNSNKFIDKTEKQFFEENWKKS